MSITTVRQYSAQFSISHVSCASFLWRFPLPFVHTPLATYKGGKESNRRSLSPAHEHQLSVHKVCWLRLSRINLHWPCRITWCIVTTQKIINWSFDLCLWCLGRTLCQSLDGRLFLSTSAKMNFTRTFVVFLRSASTPWRDIHFVPMSTAQASVMNVLKEVSRN